MSKRDQIEVLRERIDAGGAANYYDADDYEGDTIADADAEELLVFSDQLDLHDYSDNRHEKLLRHLTRLAEKCGGLAEALDEREAAEDLVRWINLNYDNPRTKCDYRIAVRAFGKHALRRGTKGDPPDSIAWISANTPRNYNPRPSRADMLDWEDDVLPLINEGAKNTRNAALFAVQFEAGLRPHCELFELTIGDIKDGDYGTELEVDGKTGERSVTIIRSLPYLHRWLSDHPASGDDDAYLWVKSNNERPSYQTFLRYFKRAADRIDLEKPVTPKNFRKSNATWLARLGYNEAFIEDRQGRERGSDAIAHYVAQFGDDRAKKYAELHGEEIETDDPEDYSPIECPRCGRDTPPEPDSCMWCSQALGLDETERIREREKRVRKAALRFTGDNPEIPEVIDSAEELMDLVEDDPELKEDIAQFAEALSSD